MSGELRSALLSLQGFSALSEAGVEPLTSFVSLRPIRSGETIFCQGEPSPFCFGVLSGEVTIQHVSKDHRFPPKVLGVVGPGGLFGESALFEDSPRLAMASASKDGRLIVIRGAELRPWIQANPKAAQPLLLALFQSAQGRLYRTSHELAVVHGVGRILGSDKPFAEQLASALDFLKGSLEGTDDLVLFRRSQYWDEFAPVYSAPEISELPPLSSDHELVQKLNLVGAAQAIDPKTFATELAALKLPWVSRLAAAVVPLFVRDNSQSVLEGLLFLASGRLVNAYSADKHLLLSSIAQPLAEALSREGRHEDSLAKSRLQQSKESFPR